jgi:hypothetical protein
MAWTRTRGSEVGVRGMRASSARELLSASSETTGSGRAVRLVCFLRILRVASALANWNYQPKSTATQ